MSEQSLRVLIIGGGIGGLATAIGLQRAGIEAHVYERAPAPREVGAGLSLWANALRALDQLGLGAAVQALGAPSLSGGIRTWRGDWLLQADDAQLQQRFDPVVAVFHRAELHALLAAHVAPECLHYGAECTHISADAEQAAAYFVDGTVATGDVLIGADGLHSVVRAQLHGPQPPTYAGYTAWRAVIDCDPALVPVAGESWGQAARFGLIPMANQRLYWFATHSTPAGQRSPDGEQAALLRIFRGWHAPIELVIAATPEERILRHDLYDRPPLSWWGRDRVTLLGDAAHPMTPNLGQGAGQALEDAVVLTRCLRDSGDVFAALRAYEAQRIPRTTAIVRQSRLIGQAGQLSNRLATLARNAVFKHALAHLQERQLLALLDYPF